MDEALATCAAALEAVQDARPEDRGALFAVGCADVFEEPVCREAIRMSPAARPELRAHMIAAACQHAYCPLLAEPRPAFCQIDAGSIADLRDLWAPFIGQVLQLELSDVGGLDVGASIAGAFTAIVSAPVVVEVPTGDLPASRGPRPVLTVTLTEDGGVFRLAAEVGGETFGPHELRLRPDAEDLAGLLEAPLRACDGCESVIRAGETVEYEHVVLLMDVLREGGVTAFTLGLVDAEQ